MLNWVKFIVVFLFVLTSVIIIAVFYNAGKPFSIEKRKAIDAAIDSGQILSADYSIPYNGAVSIVTVFGENEDGEKTAVFVDSSTEGAFNEVKLADGISSEAAVQSVKQEFDVKKILHVSLGMEEVGPVWEIAFRSENGKLNYVYLLFENGNWWKRILNL